MNITYQLDIDAPIDMVFDLVDDDEKIGQWMHGVEEISYPEGQDLANPVGTPFRMKIREGGRVQEYEGKVIARDPPRQLAITIGNPAFEMAVDYAFSQLPDGGTRLDYTCELIRGGWFIRLMGRLFSGLTRRILRKQMTALKELAERQATTANE